VKFFCRYTDKWTRLRARLRSSLKLRRDKTARQAAVSLI
jgi:hypothetical protein